MNTMEVQRTEHPAEDIEPMAIELARRQLAPNSRRAALARYALLAIMALLLGGLGCYVRDSINVITSQFDQIQANFMTPFSVGPD